MIRAKGLKRLKILEPSNFKQKKKWMNRRQVREKVRKKKNSLPKNKKSKQRKPRYMKLLLIILKSDLWIITNRQLQIKNSFQEIVKKLIENIKEEQEQLKTKNKNRSKKLILQTSSGTQ